MTKFDLTINQLESLIKKANEDENQEDILMFEVVNNRLIIRQSDWGHTKTKTLMNKPC